MSTRIYHFYFIVIRISKRLFLQVKQISSFYRLRGRFDREVFCQVAKFSLVIKYRFFLYLTKLLFTFDWNRTYFWSFIRLIVSLNFTFIIIKSIVGYSSLSNGRLSSQWCVLNRQFFLVWKFRHLTGIMVSESCLSEYVRLFGERIIRQKLY